MLDLLQEEQHAGGGGREELLHSLHQRVQVHRQRRESAYQNNRQVIIISEYLAVKHVIRIKGR